MRVAILLLSDRSERTEKEVNRAFKLIDQIDQLSGASIVRGNLSQIPGTTWFINGRKEKVFGSSE